MPDATDLDRLIERVEATERATRQRFCQMCSGTGWHKFRCGTMWQCRCNPDGRAKPDAECAAVLRAYRAAEGGGA